MKSESEQYTIQFALREIHSLSPVVCFPHFFFPPLVFTFLLSCANSRLSLSPSSMQIMLTHPLQSERMHCRNNNIALSPFRPPREGMKSGGFYLYRIKVLTACFAITCCESSFWLEVKWEEFAISLMSLCNKLWSCSPFGFAVVHHLQRQHENSEIY